MRPLLAAALLFAVSTAHTYTISNDGKSWCGFTIEDTLETIDGITHKVSGSVTLDPANLAASSATMTIDTASLDTGLRPRDEDMRQDYLETSKYPAATFKSTAVSGALPDLKVAGDFTLHGVTRRIVVPVKVVQAGNALHVTSKFNIRMTDYNIRVPDKLVLSVANDVVVRFDVFAR